MADEENYQEPTNGGTYEESNEQYQENQQFQDAPTENEGQEVEQSSDYQQQPQQTTQYQAPERQRTEGER